MTFSYHIIFGIFSSLRFEKKNLKKIANHMKNDKVVRKSKENQTKKI